MSPGFPSPILVRSSIWHLFFEWRDHTIAVVKTVTARCASCRSMWLLPAIHATADCTACGGVTRVVPGPSYTAGNVFIFVEVSAGFRLARLNASDAQRLYDYVHAAPVDAPAVALRRAVEWLPALAPLAARLSGKEKQLQLAVTTLLTIARVQYSTSTTRDTPSAPAEQ